jgi:pilus assembly protein Flp/PilA
MLLLHKLLSLREDRDERGATAVEYGLMVAMIAIVIVAAIQLFGSNVVKLYSIPAGIFAR